MIAQVSQKLFAVSRDNLSASYRWPCQQPPIKPARSRTMLVVKSDPGRSNQRWVNACQSYQSAFHFLPAESSQSAPHSLMSFLSKFDVPITVDLLLWDSLLYISPPSELPGLKDQFAFLLGCWTKEKHMGSIQLCAKLTSVIQRTLKYVVFLSLSLI